MKFFSTFDSNYKETELTAAQKEFGNEKVMLVGKSLLHYFIGFFLPMVIVGLIWMWAMFLLAKYISSPLDLYVIIGLSIVRVIIESIILCNSYIHHRLDFIIITPEKVDIYYQVSLTHRNVKSIFVQDISWVYIDKNWLWDSIVDNGNLTIETEENPHTKVHFWPIAKPDFTKKVIEDLIEKLLTEDRKRPK